MGRQIQQLNQPVIDQLGVVSTGAAAWLSNTESVRPRSTNSSSGNGPAYPDVNQTPGTDTR